MTDESEHEGEKKESFFNAYIARKNRYEGGCIMICSGIACGTRTRLCAVSVEAITGVSDSDEVLSLIVLTHAENSLEIFKLMDDNALSHRARVVT